MAQEPEDITALHAQAQEVLRKLAQRAGSGDLTALRVVAWTGYAVKAQTLAAIAGAIAAGTPTETLSRSFNRRVQDIWSDLTAELQEVTPS